MELNMQRWLNKKTQWDVFNGEVEIDLPPFRAPGQ